MVGASSTVLGEPGQANETTRLGWNLGVRYAEVTPSGPLTRPRG